MPSTTITHLLPGTWTPEEFGARGNGTHDDAAAINAAIVAANAAGGGRVLLGAGRTYLVRATIALDATTDVELVIDGVLKQGASVNVAAALVTTASATRPRISGRGTIDGNRASNTSGSWDGVSLSAADARLSGVRVVSCRRHGVLVSSAARVRIEGVTVTDHGHHGFALSGATYAKIIGCTAYDNSRVQAAGTGDGVNLAATSLDTVIVGLVAYDSAGGSGRQGYGVREAAASSCDRTLVAGAALLTNQTGESSFVGASSRRVETPSGTAGDITTIAYGDAAAAGSSPRAAAADHRHGAPAASGVGVFGDGSDGSVTISANTNLARDMYYAALTVNAGVSLFVGSSGRSGDVFRVFCAGALVCDGTIAAGGAPGAAGAAGTGGAGGTGATAQTAGGSASGGAGGSGAAGANGSSVASNSLGGAGGAGGAGSAGGGGSAGTVTAPSNTRRPRHVPDILGTHLGASPFLYAGGAGGGGGGGDPGPRGGGGGGAGGGVLVVAARSITVGTGGVLDARGGTGGGGQPPSGNSGGGGGGGGGAVLLLSNSLANSGTLSAAGGAGGAGQGTGAAGAAGSAGTTVQVANA